MIFAVKDARIGVEATPSREEARRLFAGGDLLPVYRTLLADLETPVSVYHKLSQMGDMSFLLESVEGGEHVGRYSFMGVNPKSVIRVTDNQIELHKDGRTMQQIMPEGQDPLHVVEREFRRVKPVRVPGLPRFVGGAVGAFAYDVVRYFEKLPTTAERELEVPDVAFMLVDTLVIFDHAKHQLIVLSNAHNTGEIDTAYDAAVERIDSIVDVLRAPMPTLPDDGEALHADVQSNKTREQYQEMVRAAKGFIAAGDAFQIVLSQRFSRETNASALSLYRSLRATNPSPYMFLLRFSDQFTLVGASPELMVRLEDGIATTRPIAGSRPRGKDRVSDEKHAQEMLNDPKERAEHVMLIDLGRNDLGRVCDYGTVRVTEMMFVERYSHIMHIVSNVEGRLRAGLTAFDLLRATFPAGTLSGAPKVRAMEIIEQLEGTRRGVYGGAVGYFSYDGSMDTCITIRSALMQGNRVYFQSGAGVVADSVPETEYEETLHKARAMAMAIQRAENGLL
jgi:anthranilate synthase component 1